MSPAFRDILLPDEAATTALGAAVAPGLRTGDFVALTGPLGAGKSTLARGLIRALTTPDQDVPSPTFTLVQFYESAPPVAHFDLYRLERAEEAYEIGLDEALEEGAALVEWPERLEADTPADRLAIDLAPDGQGRRARLTGHGAWAARLSELNL